MSTNGILIRFDEIFLKKGRRSFFLDQLDRSLRRALRHHPEADVRRPYGRFLVHRRGEGKVAVPSPLPDSPAIIEALSRVFGVASLSPVHILPTDWDTLRATVVEVAEAWLAARPVASFAVAARRVDKRYPRNSMEIGRDLGAAVLERHPGLRVDLINPEMRIGVEVREDRIFVFREQVQGPGGLPVGSNGKVLALLSGGIDSPVAAWSIMRRGVSVDAVYFHSFPYTSDAALEKVKELARSVGRWQGGMRLHTVPFTDIQMACRDAAPGRVLVLLYRRSMLRIAEAIAREEGSQALVTGESLGQVASQTLPNLDAIQRVVTMPVLRPLIANDKQETIRQARSLGTYDISVQPFDDCCSLFVPKHPELRARVGKLEEAEARVDLAALEKAAREGREIVEV